VVSKLKPINNWYLLRKTVKQLRIVKASASERMGMVTLWVNSHIE